MVIVTRPREKAGRDAAALTALGARVVFAPLIRIAPPRSWKALDAALRRLNAYDAVAFTSVNAVKFFFRRIGHMAATPRVVAAVGPATAEAVSAHGWKCTVVPDDARAAGLAKALRVSRGAKVLIPRAENGLETLAAGLRKAGARVTVVSAYRTIPDENGARALRRALALGADAVCFASGSAAAVGAKATKIAGAAAIAIGPTTAAALRKHGLQPAAIAKRPDAAAFARAVVAGLKGRP